ncbi:MAG: hypothetical protein M3285_01675 [Actinomycetota bacterium]|nr:hypothetical protein [Actinomycetota bacterium]
MKISKRLMAVSMALPLAVVGSASAEDFSPTGSFSLDPAKVKANPSVRIQLAQDSGEEELDHVTLVVPAGFKLPTDAKIENGDILGTADLAIDVGPRCAGGGPLSAPASFPDRNIIERDRTDEQADEGVKAVWIVDLEPVTRITLEMKGSPRKGYTLSGNIPANQFTCPPLTFDGTISAKSDGGVPIFKNPGKPGKYTFKAIFKSQESSATHTITSKIKISR